MKNLSRREFLDATAKTAATALSAKALDEMVNPTPAQASGSANTNKSGVADQVLSLPKGGGAIKGLGEKFQPDLHTGTGNFSVPIQVPPGRGGFQPELSLQYSTGAGNGVFGLGWVIGIPNVSRQTSKGIPIYDDQQDTFILSGAEDLVPVGDNRYRPRTEGLFARIRHMKNDNNDYWEVTSQKNIRSYYGLDDSAKVYVEENGRKKIFKWLLSRTEDPCGNSMIYLYQRDQKPATFPDDLIERTEKPHDYNQVYLTEIKYMNFREQGDNKDQHFIRVLFDYGQFKDDGSLKSEQGTTDWAFRPDRFSSYRSGFEIRTARRCKRILIKVRDKDQRDLYHLTKCYELNYKPFDPNRDFTNLSLLTSVTLRGFRNGETKAFPPLTFGYTEFWPQDRVFENFTAPSGSLPDRPLSDLNYELIDLTGNGLPDVIHTSPYGMRYWKNIGNCQFIGPHPMRQAPAGVMLQQPGVQFADMQGNGRADLLITGGMTAGYYETTFDDDNQWQRFHAYRQAPEFSFEDANVRLVDLDGDGVIDVLRTDERAFMYFRNRGEQGFENPRPIKRIHDMAEFPDVYFNDPRIHLADLSGDGLQDIVYVHDRRIEYWPNLGHGRSGKRILMTDAPDLTDSHMPNGKYDPRRLHFSDVDGDGLADIVYIGYDRVTIWLNRSGNGWSEPLVIKGTPVLGADAVRMADMKGNGTSGILWTFEPAAFVGSHYKYLDLTGGIKPYLLSVIENNLGASTVVQYSSSIDDWISDYKKDRPWLTHLPLPVHVVSKVEVIDHIAKSKLVTRYSYHHGYYDGREREFRGFGRMEQTDSEEFETYKTDLLHDDKIGQRLLTVQRPAELPEKLARVNHVPPIVTKTWFHPGNFLDEKAYLQKIRHEYYQGDPQAFVPEFYLEKNDSPYEAHRTLRGAILRTEMYAQDGSDLQQHPYSVTESSYQVRQIRPKGKNQYGIFFTNSRESFSFHYERNPHDPRVSHSMTLELDQYGNVTKSLEIAYPRRQPLYPEQGTHHIIYSSTDFINQGESESSYFIGHVAQSKQIEVKLPDGFSAAPLTFAQVAGLELDHPRHNLFAFSRVYYDGDAYVGLPFGRIGDQGLATRSETLAFKPGQLVEVFGDKLSEEDIIKAGYIKDMVLNDHWWIQSQRYKYDDDQYYLPIGQKDPMAPLNSSEERVYGTEFDQFAFLPVKTVDPLQNETSAENDYLTMGPFRLTELNGNRTEVAFDALGFVKRTAVMGKVTENLGDLIDSDETATTYIHYDLDAYRNEKKPLWAQVWSREDHYHVNPNPRWLEARVYSDGFGREIQAKAKAEPGLVNGIQCDRRWIGSGWKIYNNKGWVVEQYEPFFSTTNDYEPELISGVSSHLFYDPLGRVLRTDIPDGTFTKVVFDPWQQTSYDANDTVADSDWYVRMKSSDKAFERSAAEKAMAHYNTPTIVHLDTLGRAFLTIEDNGEFGKYKTRSVFDIQGSVLSMQDPRGNIAFRHTYDLNKNIIYRWQMDSGQRFFFLNTVGSQMKKWDSRHHLVESVYDLLNRPVELWVTLLPPDVTPSTRLAEKVEYGEILADAAANNFRGKIFRQFDGAGIVTFEEYDFKGNLLKKKQQILAEYRIEVNWSSVHEPQLMTDLPSNSSFQYDALNRIIASITPDVSKTVNEYDAASLMKSIVLFHRGSENKREIVRNITYNAKNQREMIEYGNGVKTLYSYDEKNLRLVELKSLSNSKVYIDNVYTYDPIGNITFKQNLSSRTICYDNAVITGDSDYVYDAKYQLIRATGRELKSNTVYNSYEDPPFVDCWNANDTKALRPYTQEYSYDSAGNINLLKHIANGGSWQRRYVYHEDNNRLKDTYLGAKNEHEFTYEFDEHGNHISFNHLQEMMWDFKDQLIMTNKGGWYKIYYLYDTIGTRTRKIIETGSIVLRKESIYFQNIEMLNEYLGTSIQEAIGVLIIFGENQHVALLETQIVHNSISVQLNPQIRYQLHDHLGSSIYELSDNSTPITYEEHFPYGETAYHECKIVSNICSKKFRYSQKEKDVETGFYYYGARYYISGLTRWISCDSIIINQNSEKSENYKINNLYAFNFDNPILYFDIIGYIGQKAINTEINQTTPTNMEDDLKNQDLPISDPTLTNEGKQALEQVKFQYQNLKGKKPCSITKEAVEALAAQYRKKAQNAAFDFIFTNEKLRNEMMTEVKKKFEELKHKGKIDKDVEFPYPPEWSDEQKSFYTNWFIEKYQEKHKGAYVGDIQDIKTAIRFHKSDLEEKAKFITIYGNDILREIEKGHNLKAWWIFFYTSEYVLGDDNRQLGSMIWDKNWTNAGHLEKWFLFWRSRLEQRKKHSFAPT